MFYQLRQFIHSRKIIPALVAFIVFQFAYIFYLLLFAPFDTKTVKPFDDFAFKDQLTCYVVHSTREYGFGNIKAHWLDIREVHLRGLTTESPEILWKNPDPDNKIGSPYITEPLPNQWDPIQKLNDSESYLMVGSVGYDDIIGIDKRSGSFVRTMTGLQAGLWWAHYAVAQKGRCK